MAVTIGNELWRELLSAPDTEYTPSAALQALEEAAAFAPAARFDSRDMEDLAETIAKIKNDPELLQLFDRVKRIILQPGAKGGDPCITDPQFGGSLQNESAFFAVILLAGITSMKALYKRNGWSEEMCGEALLDFKIWLDYTRKNYGVFGTAMIAYPWIRAALDGQVVRLGRLQCNTKAEFPNEYRVYKRFGCEDYCVLLDKEWSFDGRGYYSFCEETTAFSTKKIEETRTAYRGWAANKNGLVTNDIVTLDKREWKPVLMPGDPIINLHIPEDGPMDMDLCRDSIKKMLDFHRNVLKVQPKAVFCHSWLLDPAFRNILPEKSNVVRFQKMGYLAPCNSMAETHCRVFGAGTEKLPPEELPVNTSMQKTLAEYLKNGNVFRDGVLIVPVAD